MSDWKKPLPNYAGTKRNHKPTFKDNSGSMMMKFEVINEVAETDNAYYPIFIFGGRPIGRWLPKSQIKTPYADVIEIPRWLVDRIRDDIAEF